MVVCMRVAKSYGTVLSSNFLSLLLFAPSFLCYPFFLFNSPQLDFNFTTLSLLLLFIEKEILVSGNRLVVAADGANSRTRTLAEIGCFGWQYDQAALVIAVELASPTNTAWQRFLQTGNGNLRPIY